MKKPVKPTPPNQTNLAASTATMSLQALRADRQRLQQEVQALGAEFDSLADQLLNSFGCADTATAPLPGAKS